MRSEMMAIASAKSSRFGWVIGGMVVVLGFSKCDDGLAVGGKQGGLYMSRVLLNDRASVFWAVRR
jgi:hypothetical protein